MRDDRRKLPFSLAVVLLVAAGLLYMWLADPLSPAAQKRMAGDVRDPVAHLSAVGEDVASPPVGVSEGATSGRVDTTRDAVIRVLAGDGTPLAGAFVDITAMPTREAVGADESSVVALETDLDGICRAKIATDRPYRVCVFSERYLPEQAIVPASLEALERTFVLGSATAYGVFFTDAERDQAVLLSQFDAVNLRSSGGAVDCMDGATRVFLQAVERSGLDAVQVAGRIARKGLLVAVDDVGGSVECLAHIEGYKDLTLRLEPRDVYSAYTSPVTVALEPEEGFFSITFSLRDTAGRVPEGAQYIVARELGGRDERVRVYRAVDPKRQFSVRLPSGEYEAVYTAHRFDWSSSTSFQVGEGRGTDVALVQESGAKVRVEDTGVPSLPVFLRSLARKTATGNAGFELFNVWPTTSRAIVVRGLEPGRYEAEAWFSSGVVNREFSLRRGEEFVIRPDE